MTLAQFGHTMHSSCEGHVPLVMNSEHTATSLSSGVVLSLSQRRLTTMHFIHKRIHQSYPKLEPEVVIF